MTRKMISISIMVVAVLLSACSAAPSTAAPNAQPPSTAAVLTSAPATSMPVQPAASVTLDPCQLITSQEASALVGASFGAGTESSTPQGLKICTYKSEITNTFMVELGQAADATSAKAFKDQFLSDLQSNLQQLNGHGINVTDLPNFADGAVLVSLALNTQGMAINGSGIGVLKGAIFFGFNDMVVGGGAAPTSDALKSEATTVLGRLP